MYTSEKEAWAALEDLVTRNKVEFMCHALDDRKSIWPTDIMRRKIMVWVKRFRGLRRNTMNPGHGPHDKIEFSSCFEYGKLIRIAFCRRMALECE